MALTVNNFYSNNKILFRAPILNHAGVTYCDGDGHPMATRAQGDYLDLNSNGDIERSRSGRSFTYREPNLNISMNALNNAAQAGGHGEVLTAEKLSNVLLQDVHVSFPVFVWGDIREERYNQRSMASLLFNYAPLDRDASFAIDLPNRQFVIYRPEANKPAV